MKIHDILLRATQPKAGEILSFQEIRDLALQIAPLLRENSILPSEHTGNQSKRCKLCRSQPLFSKAGYGLFLVLGQEVVKFHLTVHEYMQMAFADCPSAPSIFNLGVK